MSADVLKTALAHHRAGRLDKAEELYRNLLQADPRNADALNLLGVIDGRLGAGQMNIAA